MGAIKDVYEVIKDLKGLVKELNDQDMAEKVVEIQEGFFEMREQIEELKDEKRQLEGRIKALSDNAALEKDLELTDYGTYIRKSEKAEGKTHQYCAACWQNYGKLYPSYGSHITM